MSVFPSMPEIVLTIFTTLLSLAVSLFLLKIQRTNSKSVKNLEDGQRILIARHAEIDELIRGKLVASQETLEAIDFLDKDAPAQVNELEVRIQALEYKKKKISEKNLLGVILMILSLGANSYLSFHTYENGGKVFLSILITVILVDLIFFVFMWSLRKLLLSYEKDVNNVRRSHDFLSKELLRAINLVRQNQQ